MKKYTYNIPLAMLLLLLSILSSCDDLLREETDSFVNRKQTFQDVPQCIASLNSCYIPLNSIFRNELLTVNEGSTDLAYLTSSDVNARFEISPANPGCGANIWEACYKGIMYCNASVEGIKSSPVEEEKKPALIGEAVTLRALYYYVLTSMFGDVPYYTDDITSIEILNKVNRLPRMDAVETRNKLIEELKVYAGALPQKRPGDIEGNRVSAPLARILIAKMALWNKQYDVALEALKPVRQLYGNLDSYSLTDTYFRYKNTPESILEVQFTYSVTGLKKTSVVASITTPSRASGTSTYDGVSIPELGSTGTINTSITPSNHFVEIYDKHTDDPRQEIIIARSYNGAWFSRPSRNNFTGKPWMGPKFWCPGLDGLADGNNQKVFRFADALLMMAEAANELDQPSLALECINEVKGRAQISQMDTYPGKEAFFEELKDERARELMGEYGRKWDLVRWGIFYESIKATIAQEVVAVNTNIRPFHEYYPIPDSEVFKSGGILTNDAYTGQ